MQTNGLPELNVERIKQYNTELKQYTEKGATLKAEQEFTSKELTKLCAELAAELGIEVTPSNIEQVYRERVAKIENTLSVGEEVLNRIKLEESGQTAQPQVVNPAGVYPQQNFVPVQNGFSGAGAPPAAPIAQPANAGYQPVVPGAAPVGQIPTGQAQAGQGTPFVGLPNMFGGQEKINL